MKNHEINQRLSKLNHLITFTKKNTDGDLELQAHWAKYICVLAAGFLEFAIAQLYSEVAKNASPSFVHNHVSHYLFKIQNPKATKFIEVAKSFKQEWGADLKNFIDDQGRSDAIGNIMTNRHLIAHGKDSQMTISKMSEYLKKSVEVLDFIEKQCGLKHEVIEVK